MLKLKEWFSKYGYVAPCAALAIVVAGVVAVVQAYGAVGSGDRITEDVGVDVTAVPEPPELSQADVARIAREEIAAQRKLDEEARATWKALLPKIVDGGQDRWSIAQKCQADIDAMVKEVIENIDAEEFADAICGWESSWKSLDGWTAHSGWAMTQFKALVVDETVLARRINERLQKLHEELTQFDTNLVATLKPESQISLAAVAVPEAKVAWLRFQFEAITAMCPDSLDKAWVESGVSFVGGQILSGIASELFSGGQENSAEGPNTAMDLIVDFAADAAAAEIVEQAIGTSRTDLEGAVEDTVRMHLSSLLSENSGVGWLEGMNQMVLEHEHTVTNGLMAASGAEREWAFNVMVSYFDWIRSQETSHE